MAKKRPSERLRKVRKQNKGPSESFGTLPYVSERTAEHVLTVRDVAKRFENAGVPRTERSITNWCQPNPQGMSRLDCFYDTNEHKYFITPHSVDAVIGEERNKLKIQGQTAYSEPHGNASENPNRDSEAFGKQPNSFGTVPKDSERFRIDNEHPNSRELETQIRDLQITNKAKDMYIDQLTKTNEKLIDEVKHTHYQLGQLESQLRQLEGPRERPDRPREPESSPTDKSAGETPSTQVVQAENNSMNAPSQPHAEQEADSEQQAETFTADAPGNQEPDDRPSQHQQDQPLHSE